MTKHEADVIGGLNMTDQISDEAYKQIMIAAQDENEPCEDAISRQAVLDGLANIAKAKARSDAQKALMGRVMFFTEKLPPVNPQKPICPSAGVDCEDCPAYEKKSECEHDHEILKAYSDGASAVLDKIRDEIREQSRMHMDGDLYIKTSSCMQIIDEYMAEGSEE